MKNKLLFASILMMGPVVALSSCGPDQIIQNTASISVNGSSSIDMNTETLLTAVVENLDEYTVVWSSSNPKVASINQSGIVTAHSVTQDTQVTITASIEGQSDVKFDFVLTVKFVESSDEEIKVTISGESSVNAGSTLQLVASVANASNNKVTWSTSNEGVATVDANGLVTANSSVLEDTVVTITATSVEDSTKSATKIIRVTASAPALPIEISISGADHVSMGSTTTLSANVKNASDTSVIWSSSNESIATVDEHGVVTALVNDHNTEVTITATSVEDNTKVATHTLAVWVGETELDDIYATQITMNKNFVNYYTNKGENTQNIEQQFKVMNKDYLVGDDNFIDFKPVTKFMKFNKVGELEDFNYKGEWIYDLTISVKNDDDTYSVVDNAPSTLIDKIDYVHCKVDFSEEAIGKAFKVKVEPGKLTQNQKNSEDYDSYYVVNYDVVITDGFNVYDSKELCYIDNRTDEYGVAWNAYKEANGLSTIYHPSNIILHSNITLTLDNLPDIFYYDATDTDFPTDGAEAARVNHSMRDWVSIYYRYLDRNSSFNIFGNYFTLDTSSLPVILYEENEPTAADGLIISNSELMTIEAYVHSTSENTDAPTSLFKDFYIKGNASRTEDSTKGGGLIFTKHNSVKTTYDNVISRSWYITFFSEDNIYDEFVVQNCKAYDSYSNFMYVWGSSNVLLKDSYFSGCGGPAIIADDVTHDGTQHRPSNVKIENSDIIANVAGTEGWFQGYGAVSAAGQIKSLSALLTPFGKTFTRTTKADTETTYFNFICLHKDGSNAGMTSSSIYGSLTIDNNESFMLANSSDPTFAGLYAQSVANSFPILKSSAGGYGYFNGTNLSDAANTTNLSTPDHASDKIYQGDYIALYFQGMMITMGYYAAGSTID